MPFYKFDDLIRALSSGAGNLSPLQKLLTAPTAGAFTSMWPAVGLPGVGGYAGTALEATQQDDSVAGGISLPAPPTGKTRHLVHASMGGGANSAVGQIFILDRLLMYPGIDNTAAGLQTFTNPVALPRYADGLGVMAFLEVTTLLGTGSPVATFAYKNSLNQSKSTTFSIVASAAVGQIMPSGSLYIPLAAGDLGVRQATSIQLSGAQSAGVSALVLAKPIAAIPVVGAGNLSTRDFVTQVASLERLYDGHCLMLAGMFAAAVTNGNFVGQLQTAYN